MRIHLLQLDIRWEDKPANHDRIRDMLRGAPPSPGDLLLLPEMFDTGFSINTDATRDSHGTSACFLRTLATEHQVFAQGSVTHGGNTDSLCRNRSLTFDPTGTLVASYDKFHPFSFGRETERFEGGDRTASFDWVSEGGPLRVFPTVCYDLRFPELFRLGVDRGAEAFTVIANWPSARVEHWRTLLRARAIENLAYVFAVNRAGPDPHLAYPGRSAVIAPTGEVLLELGEVEELASLEIDPQAARAWRASFPALEDRRSALTGLKDGFPHHRHNERICDESG